MPSNGNSNPTRNLVVSGREDLVDNAFHWGTFSAKSSLPNVASDGLDVLAGDLADVGGVLYVCTTATSGSAVWQSATPATHAAWVWPAFRPDGAALTSVGTSVSADASTSLYYTDITIPHRMSCTGVGLLTGTAKGNDNLKVTLFDSDGEVVISTASTDTTGFTADVFNQIAWTAVQTLEPGRYFVGVALDGTTDEFQCLDATHPIQICEKEGSHVYATPDAITSVATTFTADVAPIFYLY